MGIQTYDNLSVYLDLAKKTINKFAPKFISQEMLASNDAVSDVATAIMYADWRFDPDRPGKTGAKKTLYSYRNQCAIWAIKTYISNKYKNNKSTQQYSLDYHIDDNHNKLVDQIADNKSADPVDILIKNENEYIIAESIQNLLNSEMLSEKQREQIRLYYIENQTLANIGKKYGVSREAVRQNIKRAIDSIKQFI
jgi:RNA polymerase sigma factor (sigma-70 family)